MNKLEKLRSMWNTYLNLDEERNDNYKNIEINGEINGLLQEFQIIANEKS